ncbi:MAG: hypothetical protein QGF56_10070 [Verrucomicrobiota bacterium]|nr:hypothetical protein [Verrucomicrobiota bacterium]MDP6754020.1 hypothetical protein [Verrucomicrobiota bacterium]MDP7013558.1 hypothetical protein [Verrucomicrobiota bacterium]
MKTSEHSLSCPAHNFSGHEGFSLNSSLTVDALKAALGQAHPPERDAITDLANANTATLKGPPRLIVLKSRRAFP